jgi:hypothetical protein
MNGHAPTQHRFTRKTLSAPFCPSSFCSGWVTIPPRRVAATKGLQRVATDSQSIPGSHLQLSIISSERQRLLIGGRNQIRNVVVHGRSPTGTPLAENVSFATATDRQYF